MTPILSSSGVTFSNHHEEMGISNGTAEILDNIRFLVLATIRTVDRPATSQDGSKLSKTAFWTRDWLASLPTGIEPNSDLSQDFVYQSCRTAAHIYCRAVTEHIPLSKTCGMENLAQLWGSVWKVSLSRWKQIPGVFLWILLSALQAAEKTPYGRFLKSMVKGVMTFLAVESWEVVDAAAMGFVRLQRWLRRDGEGDAEEEKEGAVGVLHIEE